MNTGQSSLLLFVLQSAWFIIFCKQVMVPLFRPEVQENRKKKDMDRIRFATMSNEKKAEKNAKQKEIYNRKKYEGTSLYVLF